ncbi:MAG: ergothioneine biosynthesis protein EgtC [Actinobacteria bacterium]|nr:ergothioneine biosynthesis protein EgtC [Actinomycetota bacterium]
MCRHLAYLGPPQPLRSLLWDAPHALVEQGRAAREMIVATENPHGWGVAWWSPTDGGPQRYRSATAMWDDDGFGASDRDAVAAIGAVRRASPGMAGDPRNNAPFVGDTAAGCLAFSLNGYVFAGGREPRLRAALDAERTDALEGDTDSEVLFAITRDRVDAGESFPDALAAAHARIDADDDVYANMLLTDGAVVVGTTWNHTLYLFATDAATTVASEPLDRAEAWHRLPDRSLFVATPQRLEVFAL